MMMEAGVAEGAGLPFDDLRPCCTKSTTSGVDPGAAVSETRRNGGVREVHAVAGESPTDGMPRSASSRDNRAGSTQSRALGSLAAGS